MYQQEREYECPKCGEWINPNEFSGGQIFCPDCKTKLMFDVDYDFSGGSWHDLSHLYEVNV